MRHTARWSVEAQVLALNQPPVYHAAFALAHNAAVAEAGEAGDRRPIHVPWTDRLTASFSCHDGQDYATAEPVLPMQGTHRA